MTIDLRSDTVTRPTQAMREAMAHAEVGDDVYGDDPTAHRLQEAAAEVLGKEAALYVPSGTLANQIALQIHCQRGDEVVIGEGAHTFFYEGGAGAAWAGVQFVEAGSGGLFTEAELREVAKPKTFYLPNTSLVVVENTHNRGGGLVFPQSDVEAVAGAARELDLSLHLDGARIWNAAVATGRSPAELAAPFDTVSACFSKGLGAPVGSVLAGNRQDIARALRFRRMFGGAMRQVGILCAGALHALTHHVERLSEDHDNAAIVARGLAVIEGVQCDVASVETNIINFDVEGSAEEFVTRAAEEGVLIGTVGPHRIRAVTHLDVTRADVEQAVEIFARVAGR